MGQSKDDYMRMVQIPNANQAIYYFFNQKKTEIKNKKNEFKRPKKES
jgi:hypothetical protein